MMLGQQAGPMNQNSSSLKRKDDGQVELQNHLAIAQLGHVASHVGITVSHGPNSGWRVARNVGQWQDSQEIELPCLCCARRHWEGRDQSYLSIDSE
jgi:hypothetical protein